MENGSSIQYGPETHDRIITGTIIKTTKTQIHVQTVGGTTIKFNVNTGKQIGSIGRGYVIKK